MRALCVYAQQNISAVYTVYGSVLFNKINKTHIDYIIVCCVLVFIYLNTTQSQYIQVVCNVYSVYICYYSKSKM